MNYEDEVTNLLLEEWSYKFGIKDEKLLYLYLKLRYYLVSKNKTIVERKPFIQFLLQELHITDFYYKDVEFSTYMRDKNSFDNIIEDLEYQLYDKPTINIITGNLVDMHTYEMNILKDIKDYASKKVKKTEKDAFTQKYYLHFALERLNEKFEVVLQEPRLIEGFHQKDALLLEVELERYLQASNFLTNNLGSITESDLEDYLIRHLDLIEKDLKYLEHQYPLNEGRIDILAKDKDENIVIIELKIVEDKHLLWQSIYYPQEIKKEYGEKVRMIVICPTYSEYLLGPLSTLPVELFSYVATISNHKIEQVQLKKIDNRRSI